VLPPRLEVSDKAYGTILVAGVVVMMLIGIFFESRRPPDINALLKQLSELTTKQLRAKMANSDSDTTSLASTDPPKGTADAPIQVCWPSPAVSLPPGCRPESFSSGTPFAEIHESATLAIAILRGLAEGDRDLR
jgi:hypothetical protein